MCLSREQTHHLPRICCSWGCGPGSESTLGTAGRQSAAVGPDEKTNDADIWPHPEPECRLGAPDVVRSTPDSMRLGPVAAQSSSYRYRRPLWLPCMQSPLYFSPAACGGEGLCADGVAIVVVASTTRAWGLLRLRSAASCFITLGGESSSLAAMEPAPGGVGPNAQCPYPMIQLCNFCKPRCTRGRMGSNPKPPSRLPCIHHFSFSSFFSIRLDL